MPAPGSLFSPGVSRRCIPLVGLFPAYIHRLCGMQSIHYPLGCFVRPERPKCSRIQSISPGGTRAVSRIGRWKAQQPVDGERSPPHPAFGPKRGAAQLPVEWPSGEAQDCKS